MELPAKFVEPLADLLEEPARLERKLLATSAELAAGASQHLATGDHLLDLHRRLLHRHVNSDAHFERKPSHSN